MKTQKNDQNMENTRESAYTNTKKAGQAWLRLVRKCSALVLLSGFAVFSAACEKDAERLIAEVVDEDPPKEEEEKKESPVHDLFAGPPGVFVSVSGMTGAIDPVGTTLPRDFDGDGIENTNETTSNIWIADYPQIETSIATPVTMKIEIIETVSGTSREIFSEITSDDVEDTNSEGSENIHRNELNERTTQFQDSFSRENEVQESSKFSASIEVAGLFGSGSVGGEVSGSQSYARRTAYSETRNKWKDVPYKNNLDRNQKRLKSESASSKARKFRRELQGDATTETRTEANAGFVRAALTIHNHSVNMPVHLRNVLCTLMFEGPGGNLIPVQSFRLRNRDYSLFEVDVYGNEEFGPYVIELSNLNTVEIRNAIIKGYTPRIFIVDYEMTHVADSNYSSQLLNYDGDNLRVVEENAKGRTALLRIFGPNIREKYRLAAFDVVQRDEDDACDIIRIREAAPGVSLHKALERLRCSGINFEFRNYIYDLGISFPGLADKNLPSQVYIPGIKSIFGISNKIPCIEETQRGSDGEERTACRIKAFSEWTEEEKEEVGLWVVFAKGRYYDQTEHLNDSNNRQVNFQTDGVPVLRGIDGNIWAGDEYDLIYLRRKDLAAIEERFGVNPLETGESLTLNTRWDEGDLGEQPFYPNSKYVKYLGEVTLGEEVEFTFRITKDLYLNPDFGTAQRNREGVSAYREFKYDPKTNSKLFEINEMADFEISLGASGGRDAWLHILHDVNEENAEKLRDCGRSIDFIKREFRICVQLPRSNPDLDDDEAAARLYLRPTYRSSYRNTIWPTPYSRVKKFQAQLARAHTMGDTQIALSSGAGMLELGDRLEIGSSQYSISSITPGEGGNYTVTLRTGLTEAIQTGASAQVSAANAGPQIELQLGEDFASDWTSSTPGTELWDQEQRLSLVSAARDTSPCELSDFHPIDCLGHVAEKVVAYWLGGDNRGVPKWNNWADASKYSTFIDERLLELTSQNGTRYMRFMAVQPREQALSPDNSDTKSLMQSAQTKQGALVVWRNAGTSIRASILNVQKGTVQRNGANEITVHTAQTGESIEELSVGAGESLGVIVWRSRIAGTDGGSDTGGLYAQVIALSDGSFPANTPLAISAELNAANASVAVSGSLAYVAWNDDMNVHGRKISLRDNTASELSEALVLTDAGDNSYPEVAVEGSRALVAYIRRLTTTTRTRHLERYNCVCGGLSYLYGPPVPGALCRWDDLSRQAYLLSGNLYSSLQFLLQSLCQCP